MSSELFAAYSEFFSNGAFAALLLCAGLAIGLTMGIARCLARNRTGCRWSI